MVLLNGGVTVLPELAVSYMDEKERACVKRFREPVPFREISLVTFRPGVKLRLLKALEEEVLQLVEGKVLA